MKVSDIKTNQIQATELYKNNTRASVEAPSGGEGIRPDEVVISSRAVEMSSAVEKALEVEDIDQEKVAAIKEQVSNGTYKISPEELSKSIMKHLLYFGEPTSSESEKGE